MKITKVLRHTFFLALTGLVTTCWTVYALYEIHHSHATGSALVSLGNHLRYHLALSRVRHGELSGGKKVDFSCDVLGPVASCNQVLQAAYNGRESRLGTFKMMDEETRAVFKETIITVDRLAAALRERWQPEDPSVPVAERDRELERQYAAVDQAIGQLLLTIEAIVSTGRSYRTTLSVISAGVVFAGFLVFMISSYRRQRGVDRFVSENRSRLQEETQRVETLSKFVEAVSGGDYNIELEQDARRDHLTTMLVNMRDKLKRNAEEDRRRNWATTGVAQIGELLRAATSTAELYDNVIKFIVTYTKSNQGGLFIYQDETEGDPYLELVACYAYERKKYITKRIEVGNGLVGQCFLEGERIYLLEVPDDYVAITSGLGNARPNALLIVPMKVNDKIYGVLELASFNKYQDYEIELVEKLAESIASTVSTVRVNETTRELLEKTREQAEAMRAQEEEIRQNMEELEATQEEMRRKQALLEKELEQSQQQIENMKRQEKNLTQAQTLLQSVVDHIPLAVFWKDMDLRFAGCNKAFASFVGLSSTDALVGKSDYDMAWREQADAFQKDDREVIRQRKPKRNVEESRMNGRGETSWVLISKVPIVNAQGEVVGILGMFEDITEEKRRGSVLQERLKETLQP